MGQLALTTYGEPCATGTLPEIRQITSLPRSSQQIGSNAQSVLRTLDNQISKRALPPHRRQQSPSALSACGERKEIGTMTQKSQCVTQMEFESFKMILSQLSESFVANRVQTC